MKDAEKMFKMFRKVLKVYIQKVLFRILVQIGTEELFFLHRQNHLKTVRIFTILSSNFFIFIFFFNEFYFDLFPLLVYHQGTTL